MPDPSPECSVVLVLLAQGINVPSVPSTHCCFQPLCWTQQIFFFFFLKTAYKKTSQTADTSNILPQCIFFSYKSQKDYWTSSNIFILWYVIPPKISHVIRFPFSPLWNTTYFSISIINSTTNQNHHTTTTLTPAKVENILKELKRSGCPMVDISYDNV